MPSYHSKEWQTGYTSTPSRYGKKDSSKDPAKRSRFWHHDESYRLLRKGNGSETIEGLALNMRNMEQGMTTEAFQTSSLVKMENLKFLHLRGVKLTGTYENFPELRWLRWRECNLKTIPPGLLMSFLVTIDMSFGDLEEFDPPMKLEYPDVV
ncbi:hypothetical protein L1987_65700 [Smallanthus sonchifolius]|uniref:Uncharacterized protein n=1 Tax=Smallanthus sonchifolius TaxID=185202 RepID=A0ACB9BVF2_9ASTR|nr:hypothetical protein L1987_65700 [Smallanthus sonchifolius]